MARPRGLHATLFARQGYMCDRGPMTPRRRSSSTIAVASVHSVLDPHKSLLLVERLLLLMLLLPPTHDPSTTTFTVAKPVVNRNTNASKTASAAAAPVGPKPPNHITTGGIVVRFHFHFSKTARTDKFCLENNVEPVSESREKQNRRKHIFFKCTLLGRLMAPRWVTSICHTHVLLRDHLYCTKRAGQTCYCHYSVCL